MLSHQCLSANEVTASHTFGKQGPGGAGKAWRRSGREYGTATWDRRKRALRKRRVGTNEQRRVLQKAAEVPSNIMSEINLTEWSVEGPVAPPGTWTASTRTSPLPNTVCSNVQCIYQHPTSPKHRIAWGSCSSLSKSHSFFKAYLFPDLIPIYHTTCAVYLITYP